MLLKRLNLIASFPLAIILFSCEGVDCEEESSGTLNFKNTKTSAITVEVDGQKQTIQANETATFYNVAGGICTADITFNGTTTKNVRFAECISVCQTTNQEY